MSDEDSKRLRADGDENYEPREGGKKRVRENIKENMIKNEILSGRE